MDNGDERERNRSHLMKLFQAEKVSSSTQFQTQAQPGQAPPTLFSSLSSLLVAQCCPAPA